MFHFILFYYLTMIVRKIENNSRTSIMFLINCIYDVYTDNRKTVDLEDDINAMLK